jgi:hypothetical protein
MTFLMAYLCVNEHRTDLRAVMYFFLLPIGLVADALLLLHIGVLK